MEKLKQQKAITLVALIITIVILLILAGISISALTNQGLFTQAQNAKNATEEKTAEENAILTNYEEEINAITGGISGGSSEDTSGGQKPIEKTTLENAESAKPNGSTITVTDTSQGIVMIDSRDNEWVWVEVPISIYGDSVTATNYEGIYNALDTYASTYREGKEGQGLNWTDEWYDKCGTTYDGKNQYSQVKYITSSTNFTTAKTYYGTIYTDAGTTKADIYSSGTTYYADITAKLTDRSGCGLTYNEYQETYKKMLSSVYTNGGFWISRYEAGIKGSETDATKARLSHPDDVITDETISTFPEAVSQANTIPYNYVYCSEAQSLAKKMSTDTSKTSSLLFGIQWDLVCKYLEVNGEWDTTTNTASYYIKSNSRSWGNYKDSSLTLNRGKYNINPGSSSSVWTTYNTDTANYVTNSQTSDNTSYYQLLTTGASEQTNKMNIYDFAGNEREWTLEHATSDKFWPCTARGGSCYVANNAVSHRVSYITTNSEYQKGFRTALY